MWLYMCCNYVQQIYNNIIFIYFNVYAKFEQMSNMFNQSEAVELRI